MRRRPKQLTEEPVLFRPAVGGGGGMVLVGAGRSRRRLGVQSVPSGTAAGRTGENGQEIALGSVEETADDALTRRRSHEIARRLALRPVNERRSRRGVGELTSARWWGGAGEIDLDATVRAIAAIPLPEDDDIIIRERRRNRRSVVLAIDLSGSMKGERVRTAAATVGALARELHRDRLAVVAFWSDAAVVAPMGERVDPATVLDRLLRIPARGLTNVAFALETARRQLHDVPSREGRVLLLSDCVHNAGQDPRAIAPMLPRLDVLLDITGEKDLDLGRDLAFLGRGSCRTIASYRDVPDALRIVFAK